jgi:hypothetical protein
MYLAGDWGSNVRVILEVDTVNKMSVAKAATAASAQDNLSGSVTVSLLKGEQISLTASSSTSVAVDSIGSYMTIRRLGDYSAGQPVGFGKAEGGNFGLVDVESGSVTLTNSGSDNINTTVYYSRVGKLVTISWTSVTFDSSANAISAAFLPTTIVDSTLGDPGNVVSLGGNPTIGYRVNINHTNRTIGFSNFDMTTTGNQSTSGTSCPAASFSWVLP